MKKITAIKVLILGGICRSYRKYKKSPSQIKVILIENNRIYFRKKLLVKFMKLKVMLIFLTHNNITIKIRYIQKIEYLYICNIYIDILY